MDRLKIYISPLYAIGLFLIVYYGAFDVFCYYFIALILHEFSHYFMAKKLGYMINNLSFMPYGAKLQGNTNFSKQSHEFLVALAGPICNIIVAFIIIAIWWIKPVSYGYTEIFVKANIYLGLFNLIPIFPLDGGQAFLSIFSVKNKQIIYNIMRIVGFLIATIYLALFISSIGFKINFSLLFVSLFLFLTAIEPYKVVYSNAVDNINFNFTNVVEKKSYVVNKNTNFNKLIKYFSANYFVDFVIVDNKLNVIANINQKDVLEYISNGKYFYK